MRTLRLPVASLLLLAAAHHALPAKDMSPNAVVLETPVTQQDELYDCGLAAISALCGYYHVEIPSQQRAELAQLAARRKA